MELRLLDFQKQMKNDLRLERKQFRNKLNNINEDISNQIDILNDEGKQLKSNIQDVYQSVILSSKTNMESLMKYQKNILSPL